MLNFDYISNSKTPLKAVTRTLGAELFKHRQQAQLTLKDVGKKTKISWMDIDRAEIGRGDMRFDVMLELMLFYKINFDLESIKQLYQERKLQYETQKTK